MRNVSPRQSPFFTAQEVFGDLGLLNHIQLHTSQSVGLLWTRNRSLAEIPTTQTDIHAPGGIRNPNPSKRSAADPRLRQFDHWNRQSVSSVHGQYIQCIVKQMDIFQNACNAGN